MTPRRIGILGGTFDPIHCGHLDAARAAESALGLTEITVIPLNIAPHRPQPVASSYHRFAMAAVAVAGLRGWRASDLELEIGSPSFTTGTLQRLHDRGLAPTELFFIVGADAFAEIESWKDFPAILDRAHFAVVSRPGFPVSAMRASLPSIAERMHSAAEVNSRRPLIFLIDAKTAGVSSTEIRRHLGEGHSIAGLVPPGVLQHIEQHALYTASSPRPAVDPHADRAAAGRLHGQD